MLKTILFLIFQTIYFRVKVIVGLLDPLEEFDSSSKEIFNNVSDTNKLSFSSNGVLERNIVYDWINLSFLLTTFLKDKNIPNQNLKIPRPLTNKKISAYMVIYHTNI